jgi:hypothetical protein
MAVNLIIDGQQFELAGAATEETLRRLVDKMDKMNPNASTSGPFKEARKQVEDQAKSTKKLNVELKGLTKSADDLAEELDDAADAAKSFGSRAKDFLGKIEETVTGVIRFGASTAGVGMNMKDVGNQFNEIAQEFPYIGTALGAMGGAMIAHSANLIDTFDGLSASGAVFTNNMFELEKVAANSYLSLDQMVGIMRENSEAFAVFGGSARLGAMRFAQLNQALQQTYRRDLALLGMTSQDTAEMLAAYTAMQARNTQFQTMGVQQQTFAAANFAKEMQLLANLTGQDRKQLANKLAQDKRRADTELALSRMQGEAGQRARTAFMQLEAQFGPDSPVIDALRTSFLDLPAASSTAANLLLQDNQLGPVLDDIARGMRTGDPSATVQGITERLARVSSSFIESNRGLEGIAQFSPIAMELTEVSASLLNAQKTRLTVEREFGGDYQAFFDAQRVTLDETSTGLKDASLAVQDAGKVIRLAFNELTERSTGAMVSGFNKLEEALGGDIVSGMQSYSAELASATGASKGFSAALVQATDRLTTWANNLKLGGLTTGVAEGADEAVDIANAVKSGVAGATASTAGSFANMFKGIPLIGGLLSGGLAYATSDQDTELGAVAEGTGAGLGSMLGGGLGAAGAIALLGSNPAGWAVLLAGLLGGAAGGIAGEYSGKGLGGSTADFFGFADGGIVRQPTLAMIGEGQSDEAVIPLQNNRSVPVDIDMSGINRLADNVERMVSSQTSNSNNEEMLRELKKFNRHADQMVKRLS